MVFILRIKQQAEKVLPRMIVRQEGLILCNSADLGTVQWFAAIDEADARRGKRRKGLKPESLFCVSCGPAKAVP